MQLDDGSDLTVTLLRRPATGQPPRQLRHLRLPRGRGPSPRRGRGIRSTDPAPGPARIPGPPTPSPGRSSPAPSTSASRWPPPTSRPSSRGGFPAGRARSTPKERAAAHQSPGKGSPHSPATPPDSSRTQPTPSPCAKGGSVKERRAGCRPRARGARPRDRNAQTQQPRAATGARTRGGLRGRRSWRFTHGLAAHPGIAENLDQTPARRTGNTGTRHTTTDRHDRRSPAGPYRSRPSFTRRRQAAAPPPGQGKPAGNTTHTMVPDGHTKWARYCCVYSRGRPPPDRRASRWRNPPQWRPGARRACPL